MIGGWLIRIAAGFAVAAVVLYDAGSIAVNFFSLDSKADEIAASIATAITSEELPGTDTRAIAEEAKAQARNAGAKLVRAEIDDEGIVSIRLKRVASTIVIGRIGAVEEWAKATADARAATS